MKRKSQPKPKEIREDLPERQEYHTADGERWRVERFAELAARFQLSPPYAEAMMRLHECLRAHAREMVTVRRLYGVTPVILPPDADPEDWRLMEVGELCEALGRNEAEVWGDVEYAAALWRDYQKREETESGATAPEPQSEAASGLDESQWDTYLAHWGFDPEMFEVVTWDAKRKEEVARSPEKNRAEKAWFVSQVREWEKILSEPMAAVTGREALMNALYLRRFAAEMASCSPTTAKFKELQGMKRQHEQQYAEQLAALQSMFPELNLAGKMTFRAVVSELNRAHREYYGHADRRLVDQMFTAAEIEVLLRQSAQLPQPKYRLGLVMAVVEARHNLYDPTFRSQFKPSVLKKLEEGFRGAVEAVRQQLREPLIDLERGVMPGEGDDWPDLLPENEIKT